MLPLRKNDRHPQPKPPHKPPANEKPASPPAAKKPKTPPSPPIRLPAGSIHTHVWGRDGCWEGTLQIPTEDACQRFEARHHNHFGLCRKLTEMYVAWKKSLDKAEPEGYKEKAGPKGAG